MIPMLTLFLPVIVCHKDCGNLQTSFLHCSQGHLYTSLNLCLVCGGSSAIKWTRTFEPGELNYQMRCVEGSTASKRYWKASRDKCKGLQGKCLRVRLNAKSLRAFS